MTRAIDSDSFAFAMDPSRGGLVSGSRVSQNIRLVQMLGAGGMGNVWLAQHEGLDTQVAVKFMARELATDATSVTRFAREAKLAARIKCPHVVQIFDYATTADGLPYIVMELLEGEDLETRLTGGRELGLEDASRVIVQICKALSRAHALGIVHRDIKPDNVFLTDNDGDVFAKVLDFGIARDIDRPIPVTVSGATMGTPSYMSPEQLFHPRDVDARSDLWSAGVLAYRCLTGALPFEGNSVGAICVAINSGRFVAATETGADIPAGFDAWFARALSGRADHRFQTAAEMADAYLAELEHAGLLPRWAVSRHTKGELPRYTTDPGGISGGPITLRPPRRRRKGLRLVALGLVTGSLAAMAVLGERGLADCAMRLARLPALVSPAAP